MSIGPSGRLNRIAYWRGRADRLLLFWVTGANSLYYYQTEGERKEEKRKEKKRKK
jgi:hypothetical protein